MYPSSFLALDALSSYNHTTILLDQFQQIVGLTWKQVDDSTWRFKDLVDLWLFDSRDLFPLKMKKRKSVLMCLCKVFQTVLLQVHCWEISIHAGTIIHTSFHQILWSVLGILLIPITPCKHTEMLKGHHPGLFTWVTYLDILPCALRNPNSNNCFSAPAARLFM